MPNERSLEDRYFAYFINSVETATAKNIGDVVTYCTVAGIKSLITPDSVIDPAMAIEAETRGREHARRIFDFDWSNFNA